MTAQQSFFDSVPAGAGTSPGRIVTERVPEALYVIGDVHGRLDLLRALDAEILRRESDTAGEKWIVMLGDIVDRGAESAQAIEHILTPLPAPWQRLCLKGNHEAAMLSALEDPADLHWWLRIGGAQTLASYGIDMAAIQRMQADWPELRERLHRAIPDHHLDFLNRLPLMFQLPGYVLVHAGLRPPLPIAAQSDDDLIWIRDPFLDHDHDFGAIVVHGHTIVSEPEVRPGRIGIDTGAFASGVLTAVKLARGAVPEFVQARR